MYIITTDTFDSNLTLHVGQNQIENFSIEVMEVYSEYGRCYSIFSEMPIHINLTIKYILNINR